MFKSEPLLPMALNVKTVGMAHEEVELIGQKIPLKLFVAPQLVIVPFLEKMN